MLMWPMTDPDTVKNTPSPINISTQNESDIEKWTTLFHCTRAELLYAIRKIGPSSFKVEAYLKRQHA